MMIIHEIVDEAFAAHAIDARDMLEAASHVLDGDPAAMSRLVRHALATRLAWGQCQGMHAIYRTAFRQLERVAAGERRAIPDHIASWLAAESRKAWRTALETGLAQAAA